MRITHIFFVILYLLFLFSIYHVTLREANELNQVSLTSNNSVRSIKRVCNESCTLIPGTRLDYARQETMCWTCVDSSNSPVPSVKLTPHNCRSVPGLRMGKVKQCWKGGWLELDNSVHKFDNTEVRNCMRNQHIVFTGNSITRYIAWALVDKVSNYKMRQDFKDVNTRLWGSHAEYFTKSWSLKEASENQKEHSVKLWRYRTSRQDSGYWVPAINLNVTFGHILEFEDGPGIYPGNPWDVVERSKEMYDSPEDPSLIVFSMGLRALTSTSLHTYPMKVVRTLKKLRQKYPSSSILLQLMGASFDELRPKDYVHQHQRSITEHNLAVLKLIQETKFPVLSINELQSQQVNANTTIDGIHFLEGTGVNEAIVELLLNRIC